MKKVLVWFLALFMLVSAAAGVLAEDYSSLTDEELVDLYNQVHHEMQKRGIAPEDAVPAPPVEKLSDYTARAWPITEESDNELVDNFLNRIGTVDCVKGTIAEVLAGGLPRVLIYAGEDGASLPVVIEVPATSSYLPQPGDRVRVYAEGDLLLNGKPLLKGRYFFLDEE